MSIICEVICDLVLIQVGNSMSYPCYRWVTCEHFHLVNSNALETVLNISDVLWKWTIWQPFLWEVCMLFISHICWVFYVLTLAIFSILVRCSTTKKMMESSSRKDYYVCGPRLTVCDTMVCSLLLSLFGLVIKIQCNNDTGYTVTSLLSLYMWNLNLAHIKLCIQFWS
jgi:hypothetical protein